MRFLSLKLFVTVELVSRRSREPYLQARINSVKLQMENQLALVRVTGELERSTEVMVAMQRLIKIPEIQAAMMTMSKEMTKVILSAEADTLMRMTAKWY